MVLIDPSIFVKFKEELIQKTKVFILKGFRDKLALCVRVFMYDRIRILQDTHIDASTSIDRCMFVNFWVYFEAIIMLIPLLLNK